jgi:hypothetical protein
MPLWDHWFDFWLTSVRLIGSAGLLVTCRAGIKHGGTGGRLIIIGSAGIKHGGTGDKLIIGSHIWLTGVWLICFWLTGVSCG